MGKESLLREGRPAGFTPVRTLSAHKAMSHSAAIAHRAYTSKRAPGTLDVPVVRAAHAASLSTKRMALLPVSCSLSWETEATIAKSSKMEIALVEAAKASSLGGGADAS